MRDDADLDAPLRRHLVRHEREVAALAIAELRRRRAARASPQTTRSPILTSRSLRQAAPPSPATTMTASMRWRSTVHPAAVDAHVGPHVGRRIEIVRARSRRDRPAAASASCSSTAWQPSGISSSTQARAAPASVAAETFSVSCEKSSLVRPISKCSTSNCAAALDDGIEDGVEELRVDEVAFGLDDDRVAGCVWHGRMLDYSVGSRPRCGRDEHGDYERRLSAASTPTSRCATTCGCSASCSARRCAARRDSRSSSASSACARSPNATRVSSARRASRRWRGELRAMPVEAALPIARSFAHFLNLANVAEQHHRVRRRRAYQRDPRGAAAAGLDRGGAAAPALDRRRRRTPCTAPCCSLGIELVVTAHPTEIMRRSLQHKYRRIADALADLDHTDVTLPRARDAASRRCAARSPRPGRPKKSGASGRRRSTKCGRRSPCSRRRCGTRCRSTAARSIGRCGSATGRGLPLDAAPIRFGSWIGGDRDGNPFVTPDVTRSACLMARWTALSLYAKEIEQLRFELSMSDASAGAARRRSTARTSPIARCCASLQQRLDASRQRHRGRCSRRRRRGRRSPATRPTRLHLGAGDVRAGTGARSSRCSSATARCTPPATASSPTGA